MLDRIDETTAAEAKSRLSRSCGKRSSTGVDHHQRILTIVPSWPP